MKNDILSLAPGGSLTRFRRMESSIVELIAKKLIDYSDRRCLVSFATASRLTKEAVRNASIGRWSDVSEGARVGGPLPCSALRSGGPWLFPPVPRHFTWVDETTFQNGGDFEGCLCRDCSSETCQCKQVNDDTRSEVVSFECHQRCRCGAQCPLRATQQRRTASLRLQLRHSADGKGWGCITLESIAKGRYVCDYSGERLSLPATRARQARYDGSGLNYLLTVREHFGATRDGLAIDGDGAAAGGDEHGGGFSDGGNGRADSENDGAGGSSGATTGNGGENGASAKSITALVHTTNMDATRFGNESRFMNHSCDPCLAVHVIRVGGMDNTRLALFARRDVLAGEELTFSYGGADARRGGLPCRCGAASCAGFLPCDNV
ncbi:unnamed protein product [Phaeothamnion confervicola]